MGFDPGLFAGGIAEGAQHLPGLIVAQQRTKAELATHEQEMKIKKAVMLVDLLKSPDIPDQVKASHLYPQYRSLVNDSGAFSTTLPDLPEGTWQTGYTKYFNEAGKLVDAYRNGKRDLDSTIQLMDAHMAGITKIEHRKFAEEQRNKFLAQEILAKREGFKEEYVPKPNEMLSEAQMVEQPMSEDRAVQYGALLDKDQQKYVTEQKDLIPYNLNGRPVRLTMDQYIKVEGLDDRSEFSVYLKDARKRGLSDMDAVNAYEASKKAVARAGVEREWEAIYGSYLAECKNKGVVPDPLHVFMEGYKSRIAYSAKKGQAQAAQDVKDERRKARTAAQDKDE